MEMKCGTEEEFKLIKKTLRLVESGRDRIKKENYQ